MINVSIDHKKHQQHSDHELHDVVFNFDGELIFKCFHVSGESRVICGEAGIAYTITRKYKEAVWDYLYRHRGKFGAVERRFSNVLFRLTERAHA